MTDEHADAEPTLTDEQLASLLNRPLTEFTEDELMAFRAAYELRGIRIHDSLLYLNYWRHSIPELVALATPIAVYSKAFLETLAKHHADAVAEVLRKSWRRSGTTIEAEIGLDGDEAAKIIVTADLPDEAMLALLDLDVTADELRGKELRWDDKTSSWRPEDD